MSQLLSRARSIPRGVARRKQNKFDKKTTFEKNENAIFVNAKVLKEISVTVYKP